MFHLYFDLLKEWCDALLELQVNEIKSPGIYGGIMCPACSRIHGRCADAVYPLMYMAHTTGDQRYLEAAVKLQEWSEHVTSPDGSWVNEPEKTWKGITVFGALSLAEALRHHGMLLDKTIYDRWRKRLSSAAQYIYNTFTMDYGNINYPITASALLTAAGMVLDDQDYINRGREFAHNSMNYFTENKLIFGEGHGISASGKRAVDLGYNVEESLPALALYGVMTGDEEVLRGVTASLREHMEFMLPDGAWDNSWGTRNYKWSYWGSRTSDGSQSAYLLLADRDARFAEVARRNTLLLKNCTHDGMLYGGPHYFTKGELPCIHHTFCKAKALATILDYNLNMDLKTIPTALPREVAKGVREYPEIGTYLVAQGDWRATITSYDWEYMKLGHASGGSLSMLWHKELGPVLSASLTEYSMLESTNMQRVKDVIDMSLTPRLELTQDGEFYRNINDNNAVVKQETLMDEIRFRSMGRLVNGDQKDPSQGEVAYNIEYVFKDNSFEILIQGDYTPLTGQLRYYLPMISDRTEEYVQEDSNRLHIGKGNNKLTVTASLPIISIAADHKRIFNHVPGFEAIPFYLSLKDAKECKIIIAL
ncbi:MAG: hypothetical protein K0S76_1309 [Herbinix sp.]|jgi:hypothetical protein|nr:hypothetical protein [Herbinix sp.]